MIVDDSMFFRKYLNLMLNDAGYKVIEACDGQSALSKINDQHIHLLICDLDVINMDGMELLHKLRYLEAYRSMPVIALSADKRAEWKREGSEMGIRAWISKPFQPEQIITAVSKFISVNRAEACFATH